MEPTNETDRDQVQELLETAIRHSPRGAQARLADRLGVSSQTVSAWISGTMSVNPKWYVAIESALGLESWALARAAGLYEPLGLDELDDHHDQLERWRGAHPDTVLLDEDPAELEQAPRRGLPPRLPHWSAEHAARLSDAGEDLTEREKERLVRAAEEAAAPRRARPDIEDHAYAADVEPGVEVAGIDIEELLSRPSERFSPPDDGEDWGA